MWAVAQMGSLSLRCKLICLPQTLVVQGSARDLNFHTQNLGFLIWFSYFLSPYLISLVAVGAQSSSSGVFSKKGGQSFCLSACCATPPPTETVAAFRGQTENVVMLRVFCFLLKFVSSFFFFFSLQLSKLSHHWFVLFYFSRISKTYSLQFTYICILVCQE